MRWILVVGLVTACDGSCPVVPLQSAACVEDGLEDVSLQGKWTLTGTTTEGYASSLPPRHDVVREITLGGGCGFAGDDFADGECGMDDNVASCEHPSDSSNNRTLVVCKNQQGELVYSSSVSMHRIPTPYLIYVDGVLSR